MTSLQPGPSEQTLMLIGGSGFFGKSFLDAFSRGALAPWRIREIIVVARHASALATAHPELMSPGLRLLDADVSRCSILPKADLVIHAATSSDARRYVTNAESERANILASVENFKRIARTDLAAARILYTSSGAVYGQQPDTVTHIDETSAFGDVDDMVAYKRDYAEAKREVERQIARLGNDGFKVAIARCFAFVGVYLPRDQHFAIGNFIAAGVAGRPITVHARHPVYRSYMHADDLVRWLMTMVTAADVTCPVFNVGSDESLTVQEIALTAADVFRTTAEIPALASDAADRYVPSVAKARRQLGLEISFTVEQSLRRIMSRLIGVTIP
ncbi:NAD(P)-dependent oxidoreductase [Iodidimonas sp. SYSU 1G8]|uniref:NAD-dependent epimerase/dehydratase family protein n=1 Tax=Iodidimonas sp. SYSU 1G8 TaxID=3133967 RepID=UPI0031FE8A13